MFKYILKILLLKCHALLKTVILDSVLCPKFSKIAAFWKSIQFPFSGERSREWKPTMLILLVELLSNHDFTTASSENTNSSFLSWSTEDWNRSSFQKETVVVKLGDGQSLK
jgi:hypothetical protein